MVFVVILTNAERRIPVQYAKRVMGRKMYGGQASYIPIKVNMTGVMPIIFASTLCSLPGLIFRFINLDASSHPALYAFFSVFNYNSALYLIVYVLLIVAFNSFYVAIQYNPVDIANQLRKNNGTIPGIRPGKPTSDFITKTLSKITLIGAVFLAIVAGFPIILGNITGTSDALPVEGQLQLIRALQPDADTIGIVYTTSEANSVYSISVYEELATDYGFTIDAVGVTSQAEVTQAVDTLLSHGVDCLSNLTDNNVVGVLGAILEKTDEAGIPVYGSEVEQVKLGCVGGAGLDYIQLGIQTGLMAAKVLTGEAACEDLPYETIENYGLYINSDAAAELGITIPDDIAQEAQECAE